MIELIRRHPGAFLFSVVLHVLVIGLTLLEFSDSATVRKVVSKQGPEQTIQAEIIDNRQLEKREQKLEQQKRAEKQKREAEAKRKRELAEKKKRESERKKAEAEKKKAEAERKRKLEQQKRAAAEKKRKEEEQRRKKAEEEKRKQAEAERKRVAEEKRKAEAERKRKEEEERKRAEAERQRAEQERLAAEAEQRRKEAELKARLAAEERQRELDSKRARYYSLIREKISRNWRQPANAGDKPQCELNVIQGPGGVILDVTFGECPGTREYRLSVESAVLKSDPLPKPEDPELFERNINLIFKPND